MKRPHQHQSGDLGETRLREAFLHHGWIVEPIGSDYGFDFFLQPTAGDDVLPEFALLQSKASAKLLRSNRAGDRIYRIETKYLAYWQTVPIPAFIGVVELPSDTVWLASCHEAVLRIKNRCGENWDQQASHVLYFAANARISHALLDVVRSEVNTFWLKWHPTPLEQMAKLATVSHPVLAVELLPVWTEYVAKRRSLTTAIEEAIGGRAAENMVRRVQRLT